MPLFSIEIQRMRNANILILFVVVHVSFHRCEQQPLQCAFIDNNCHLWISISNRMQWNV